MVECLLRCRLSLNEVKLSLLNSKKSFKIFFFYQLKNLKKSYTILLKTILLFDLHLELHCEE